RGGVYYAFLLQSQTLFLAFFLRRDESLHSLLSRLRCRFAVSVVAHYRQVLRKRKGNFQVFIRSLENCTKPPESALFNASRQL
ncbi:hypothetical protein, partial [Erwinia sp. S59]|uniref:hypothetical protein n=1 Tax=Erwinia sp. S59 TaxID=2769340 RepID=UPI002572970D